ncbi:MAG: M48 family metalloprotease [Pseudomonadota bacterium]|nr:M48 family metalloprotease [Pseudomonadota bacterium]
MTEFFRRLAIGVLLGMTALAPACTTVTNPATGQQEMTAVSPAEEKRIGAQQHPQVLAEFGGAYNDPALAGYVDRVGRSLAANAELPADDFTFTLLDTPVVNAFALPGGYVYVTRGLLSILNTEAELAGVIGHEIGHVTARHGARRQTQGMFAGILAAGVGILTGSREAAQLGQVAAQGYLASYSRDNEREADGLGVRYLARTGYTTFAMSDSLRAIGRHADFLARSAGQEAQSFNFLSTHPQTPERVANTVELARNAQTVPDPRIGRDDYLAATDGMIYGDSPEQGFVRGTSFLHPTIRFAFQVPDEFTLDNLPSAVMGADRNGARIIFDQEPDRRNARAGGSMTSYIANVWARGARGGQLEAMTVAGMPAATAVVQMNAGNTAYEARLVAIRFSPDQIFRFLMAAPARAFRGYDRPFRNTIESFRVLGEREASQLKPLRLRVVTVRRGDTVESLAASMRIDRMDVARFRTINAMAPDEGVVPGQRVKIISE